MRRIPPDVEARILRLRNDVGLSVRQTARECGVGSSTVERCEKQHDRKEIPKKPLDIDDATPE